MQYVSINGRVFLPFFFLPICLSFSIQGRFELLTLSGSYTCTATGNVQREIGRLSVSLANPDGSVFGGTVVGSLVAAMPIQVSLMSAFFFAFQTVLQLYARKCYFPLFFLFPFTFYHSFLHNLSSLGILCVVHTEDLHYVQKTCTGFSSIYQLILGSFKQNIKLQILRRHSAEPSTAMGSPSVSDRVQIPTPTAKLENVEENSVSTPNGDENTISDHNLTRAFLQNSEQNGSQPSDPVSDEKALT